MKNELQKDDYYLKGDLGSVRIYGTEAKITKIISKEGSSTITLSQVVKNYLEGVPITEDAEFEIIDTPPKELPPPQHNDSSI